MTFIAHEWRDQRRKSCTHYSIIADTFKIFINCWQTWQSTKLRSGRKCLCCKSGCGVDRTGSECVRVNDRFVGLRGISHPVRRLLRDWGVLIGWKISRGTRSALISEWEKAVVEWKSESKGWERIWVGKARRKKDKSLSRVFARKAREVTEEKRGRIITRLRPKILVVTT